MPDVPCSFAELNLARPVQDALSEAGFAAPTDIQSIAVPPILAGKDVVVCSQAGSGKTTAYVLSLLSRTDLTRVKPQVLVLVPTQEVAVQATAAFARFGNVLSQLRIATIHGGQSLGTQIAQLRAGPHVVVGTAARLVDHLQRELLDANSLLTIVLDDVDTMLEMGFSEDIQRILRHAPKPRQTLLLSASLPDQVQQLADQFLDHPVRAQTAGDATIARPVRHRACAVQPQSKLGTLTQILDCEPTARVMIRVKTEETSAKLAENLCLRGYEAVALSGHDEASQRALAVKRFESGEVGILVAAGSAATELENERIGHVIHYDFPDDVEAYVHRISHADGGSGLGQVILLVTSSEKAHLESLERMLRQEVPWIELPMSPAIQSVRVARLWDELRKTLSDADLTESKAIVSAYLEKNPDVSAEGLAAALTFMAMTSKRETTENQPRKPDAARRPRSTATVQKQSTTTRSRDRSVPSGKRRERHAPRRPVRDNPAARSMVKYRIEVGHAHGVKPGNIVGAIAHESGIRGSDIGGIDIQTHFSTVDLPQGLSQEQLEALSHLRVAGQQLRLSKWNRGGDERLSEQPREFRKRKHGKPSWKK